MRFSIIDIYKRIFVCICCGVLFVAFNPNAGNAQNGADLEPVDFTATMKQLYGCWDLPEGFNYDQDYNIPVMVDVNSDKTVKNIRIMSVHRYKTEDDFKQVADSVKAAFTKPECNVLKFDEDDGNGLTVIMTFFPKDKLKLDANHGQGDIGSKNDGHKYVKKQEHEHENVHDREDEVESENEGDIEHDIDINHEHELRDDREDKTESDSDIIDNREHAIERENDSELEENKESEQ